MRELIERDVQKVVLYSRPNCQLLCCCSIVAEDKVVGDRGMNIVVINGEADR